MTTKRRAFEITPGTRIDFYVGRIPYTDTVFETAANDETVVLTVSGKRTISLNRQALVTLAQEDRPQDSISNAPLQPRPRSQTVRGVSID